MQIRDATAVAAAVALLARRSEIGGGRVERLVALATPAASNSCWIAPIPPPTSSSVAPSTPSAFNASISARVEGMGPFSRYLRNSEVASFSL